RLVDLANGDRLRILRAQDLGEVIVVRHLAAADEADRDPVARSGTATEPKRARGRDLRRGERLGGCSAEETTARDRTRTFHGSSSSSARIGMRAGPSQPCCG